MFYSTFQVFGDILLHLGSRTSLQDPIFKLILEHWNLRNSANCITYKEQTVAFTLMQNLSVFSKFTVKLTYPELI